jgi:hypothetical protein
MTLIQDNPQQEPLFTLAPPPTSPKPERNKLKPWHIAVLIVGVPVFAFLSCVGANTVAHWFIHDAPAVKASGTVATHKASAKPTPTGPHYDIAGYRAALNGSTAQAFVNALGELRNDAVRSNFTAAVTDAPRLIDTANRWLSLLRRTTPPPSYSAGKVQYILAAIMARRPARTIQQGLQTVNLGLLQRGADQISKARWLLARANAPAPKGS